MKTTTAVLASVAGLMLASAASAHGSYGRWKSFQHSGTSNAFYVLPSKLRKFDKGVQTSFRPSPFAAQTAITPSVPEPGTWAMMIVGVGLVGFQLRRKQKDLGTLAV